MDGHLPPKLAKANLEPSIQALVDKAKQLYQEKVAYFAENHKPPAFCVAAPGRVNLIGEHTDYTEGFVLPLALDLCTVVYGTGFVHSGKGTSPTMARLRMISAQAPDGMVEERKIIVNQTKPPDAEEARSWVDYVSGVVAQYLKDLPTEGYHLDFAFALASDVPLGSGLSSSASLEVSIATFLECFLKDLCYPDIPEADHPKHRALRCQAAEHEWAHSPCGIMDQLASSAAVDNNLILIDCRSLEVTPVPMKEGTPDEPVILVTNSMVTHSIADGEYGLRRKQCNDALEGMQAVPLYHVLSLRDATLQDVKDAKEKMDEVAFKRATHVVSENSRVKECKVALKMGLWSRVGELMNASHKSLKEDFEVSCEEVDTLVDLAQAYEGVFGSRITGGGFGGCTVTLVKKSAVDGLVEHLKTEYKSKHGKECECFTTHPGKGARALGIDMHFKPEGGK